MDKSAGSTPYQARLRSFQRLGIVQLITSEHKTPFLVPSVSGDKTTERAETFESIEPDLTRCHCGYER
jgi:hypothetical protein